MVTRLKILRWDKIIMSAVECLQFFRLSFTTLSAMHRRALHTLTNHADNTNRTTPPWIVIVASGTPTGCPLGRNVGPRSLVPQHHRINHHQTPMKSNRWDHRGEAGSGCSSRRMMFLGMTRSREGCSSVIRIHGRIWTLGWTYRLTGTRIILWWRMFHCKTRQM